MVLLDKVTEHNYKVLVLDLQLGISASRCFAFKFWLETLNIFLFPQSLTSPQKVKDIKLTFWALASST